MEVDRQIQKPDESHVDSIGCEFACSPLFNPDGRCFGRCFKVCPDVCKTLLVDGKLFHPPPDLLPPPPPPPPPPPLPMRLPPFGNDLADKANQKHLVSTAITLAGCIIGVFLFFGICCAILRFCYTKQRNSRRARSAPIFFGTQEDFLVEDQEPEVDHPIWYINTVGLQQSVIDSITVFTYKKDELLIDGTECSVCLNAFQEDESLRLLPKCSHAFHIPCIDTWLRSHKNCPLCRAPIVSDNFDAQSDLSVASSSGLSSREDTQVGNSQSGLVVTSSQLGEGAARNESGIGDGEFVVSLPVEEGEAAAGNSKMSSSDSVLRSHSRGRSDVPDSRQAMGAEMQPIRRSVSMDSSSALAIYRAVANAVPGKRQVNSDSQLAQLKKSKNVAKRASAGSLSFRKLVKSSSIGRALQKGPVSMKRSFSSSGKASSSLSRHTRSHDSFLPL